MNLPAILLFMTMTSACATTAPIIQGTPASVHHSFRLRSGDDLLGGIKKFVETKRIHAGAIVTVVGSLGQAALRYANRPETSIVKKDLEIVSFTGTVSVHGSHLHLSVSGPQGETVGGHLMEGSKVRTTAEITLVEFTGLNFERELDPASGYKELVIRPRAPE